MNRRAIIIAIIVVIAAAPIGAITFIPAVRSQALVMLGSTYATRGEYDKAIECFTKAIDTEPTNAWAYKERAEAYAAIGDEEHRLSDLNKQISLNPKDDEAYLESGDTCKDNGDYQGALANYSKYISLHKHSAKGYELRAEAGLLSGDYDGAIRDCDESLQLSKTPLFAAYKCRGRAHLKKGEFQAAIADLNQYIDLDKNASLPSRAEVLNDRADAYLHANQADRCIADCNEALRLLRSNEGTGEYKTEDIAANSFYLKAVAYDSLKKADDAQINYRRYMAVASEESERPEQFEEACKKLGLKIPPLQAEAREHLKKAEESMRQGNWDASIAQYSEAVKISPAYPEAFDGRAYVYLQKKDYKAAANDYSQAIALNPFHRDYYMNRGNLRQETKDIDLAIQDFTKALEIDASNSEAYDSRGMSYLDKSEPDQAIADFRKAIELSPLEGEPYFHAGQALETINRQPEAYTCYAKYVELARAHKDDAGAFSHLEEAEKKLDVLKASAPSAQKQPAEQEQQSEFLKRLGESIRRSKERGQKGGESTEENPAPKPVQTQPNTPNQPAPQPVQPVPNQAPSSVSPNPVPIPNQGTEAP